MLVQLFDLVADILSCDAAEMGMIVYAWSLNPGAAEKRIGNNFGQAHRDKSYADTHSSDGNMQMVTTWVPFGPVTTENGCMHVVPLARDVRHAPESYPD